jgi:hypothetical protein
MPYMPDGVLHLEVLAMCKGLGFGLVESDS